MGVTVEWLGPFRGPGGEEGWRLLRTLREARVVARSRTTVTESGILDLPAGPVPVHRKVYSYRGIGAALAGAFRTTFAAAGRARLEAAALARLGALGLAPEPVAVAERRTAGFLRKSMVATRSLEGGRSLDDLPAASGLPAAAGAAAGRMHAAGLADLSLAARNLVAAPTGGGSWRIVKVDSGRLREAAPGDPARAADLADLLAGLEGRWDAFALEGLRAAYAAEAGGLPPGLHAALAAARSRLSRRR